jgi:enoyl-[acyl-carrier protein] reductase I
MIAAFDQLIEETRQRSPLGELVDIDDVGAVAAILASPMALRITGTVIHVDAEINIIG